MKHETFGGTFWIMAGKSHKTDITGVHRTLNKGKKIMKVTTINQIKM